MRLLFMGTPDFAVPILKTLAKNHEVLAVVTQPDRPKGRGHGVMFSPVKEYAVTMGVPVFQPLKVRGDENFIEDITALKADVFVVVAYGQILPEQILNIPSLGCINIHASLLPKYRGAAPMQYSILNGDDVTGVTIMYMDKGMDTGDMIFKKELPISHTDKLIDVHDKMSDMSCECILEALKQIEAGTAKREPQNNEEATYAPMLKKDDGLIDWQNPTSKILNQVRALDPWPGTFTYYDKQPLKIWECKSYNEPVSEALSEVKPGEVLESDKHLLVKTGDGALSITVLQGQGGKRMQAADYLRGKPIPVKTILGI